MFDSWKPIVLDHINFKHQSNVNLFIIECMFVLTCRVEANKTRCFQSFSRLSLYFHPITNVIKHQLHDHHHFVQMSLSKPWIHQSIEFVLYIILFHLCFLFVCFFNITNLIRLSTSSIRFIRSDITITTNWNIINIFTKTTISSHPSPIKELRACQWDAYSTNGSGDQNSQHRKCHYQNTVLHKFSVWIYGTRLV